MVRQAGSADMMGKVRPALTIIISVNGHDFIGAHSRAPLPEQKVL